MKVMQLTDRIIFVDDIVSIYEEYKCSEYTNYTAYFIETKNKRISVKESDYKKVKEYLLSLNEPVNEELPKEDKKLPEKLKKKKIINGSFEGKTTYIYKYNEYEIGDAINELIYYLKSKGE